MIINKLLVVKYRTSIYRIEAANRPLIISYNSKTNIITSSTDVSGSNKYLLSSQQKSRYLCKLLLEFPIVNEIFLDISVDPRKVVARQHIVGLLKKKVTSDCVYSWKTNRTSHSRSVPD